MTLKKVQSRNYISITVSLLKNFERAKYEDMSRRAVKSFLWLQNLDNVLFKYFPSVLVPISFQQLYWNA